MKYDYSLKNLYLYFITLGSIGFGGPVALVHFMHHDLVEKRKWISEEEFRQGLALSQLAPGPLAAQLSIYFGWLRGGVLGGTITGILFILPSFLIVCILAYFYIRHQQVLPPGVTYGVGACIISIITFSAIQLYRRFVRSEWFPLTVCLCVMFATIFTQSASILVFIASGIIAIVIKFPPNLRKSYFCLSPLFLYFFKIGAIVYGGGFVIIPFLHQGVVLDFNWVTEKQFLDAIAVGMLTPGPVVITVAFIGYLVKGFIGALTSVIALFLPCYLIVILIAPIYTRVTTNLKIKAFIEGVTSAAIGSILGASFLLSRNALIDRYTIIIAIVSFGILILLKKFPQPILILAAGIAGVLIK